MYKEHMYNMYKRTQNRQVPNRRETRPLSTGPEVSKLSAASGAGEGGGRERTMAFRLFAAG